MTLAIPKLISHLWKPQSRRIPERRHLMLAGINQAVFLNQWGAPEVRINVDRLEDFCHRGSVASDASPGEEVFHSIWIYAKKDRICFFTNKRLVSHFKWSAFQEKKKVLEKADLEPALLNKKPSHIMTHALSMVA
jgi:hypothetical protein